MLDEFLNKYLLTFLKTIKIRAMKLNVQAPSCMAQKCIMLRTKRPIYADEWNICLEWNISKDLIITCN